MFTDNILQYSYVISGSDHDFNVRKNPFLNNNNDSKDEGFCNGSSNSLSNSLDNSTNNKRYLSIESLSISIKECKQEILNTVDDIESKSKLIESLIQLNERLHMAKEYKIEEQSDFSESDFLSTNCRSLTIAGHSLKKHRQGMGPRRYCEVCCGIVRTATSVYDCTQCIVSVHDTQNCLHGLSRSCPSSDFDYRTSLSLRTITESSFSSTSNYYINIDSYPVTGNLTQQQFLCAECNAPLRAVSKTNLDISLRSPAKLCHYYRKFYCTSCHWDNRIHIPATYFMLSKWKKMAVCRSAYISLMYLWDKALFRIPLFWEKNNHRVENILIIRRKLFSMRFFIYRCQVMRKISEYCPEWVIDQPYLVTMKFVEGICDGASMESVQVLYSNVVVHIPQCEVCRSMCKSCHLCEDPEILYVMSRTVWCCNLCFVTCIHENCGLQRYKVKSEYICYNCSKS